MRSFFAKPFIFLIWATLVAHFFIFKPAFAATPDGVGDKKQKQFRTVSRAVGEVGEEVVTSREVRINRAIEAAIGDRIPGDDVPVVMSGNEKGFPQAVSQVLDEWAVYLEAKALASQAQLRGDLSAGLRQVQTMWAQNEAWRALEASEKEVQAIIQRKLIARELIRLKSDPQLAPVSDEDALSYYRKNRLRFGSSPFSAFKDSIKSHLVKQQTERRLAEWREVLRRKYKVRNFIAG